MRNRILSNALSSLLIAFCFAHASDAYAQSKAGRAQHVNKIFIASVPGVEMLGIRPFLKTGLERRGFEVVGTVSDADAVLELVSAQEIFTTEYDMANLPITTSDSIYRLELTSPGRAMLWKVKLKFGKLGREAENEYVARRVAEKLSKKYKRS